ncbi:MAG: hypothetical protein E6G81_04445 [Alphaproteobacteria bacterium]|nr:MAG: hypothetical protein E6G81_04445 [Alphaproteobacteria bacterium]
MVAYDEEKLKKMAVAQRWQLYRNARIALTSGGQKGFQAKEIIELIESSGLPFYEGGGLTEDDPIYRRMVDIVHSAEGKRAALASVEAGWPALCGVDQLLREALGAHYGKHDLGTATAGDLVAKLMRSLGYEEAGNGTCPPDCVARTGIKWRPKNRRATPAP